MLSRELVQRRVPHFLAIYLGASWGLVQFVTFLADRYGLSPYLTELTLLGFALLIPSVILFTYQHGRPGADSWTPVEKIGIPLNLLIATAVLIGLFHDKDLGAVVTRVSTTNEAGQTVEREIARSSFRKRLALFNFDGPAEDTATAWLRYGLPLGITTDLSQDMFIDLRPSALFRARLRQLGYRSELNIPLSLKRRIATEQHLPYFTDARLSRTADRVSVDLGLYETARGELVQRRTYAGTDIFALIDEISDGLKRDLELPETNKVPDLPVSEVLTASLPAFREFAVGAAAVQINDVWPQAIEHFEKAARLDPTFAYAWLSLHQVYVYSNQSQKSMPPLQKAIDHVYRLPERLQYDVKAQYYMMKQDKDRAYAAARMKVDLFPDDISGYALLAQFQRLRDDRDGMIASIEKIFELDPSQQELLRQLGTLHESKGDFDGALRYYTQYAERFPDKYEAFLAMGNLQRLQGKHENARANYDKAALLASGGVAPLLALARLERDLGNFEASHRQHFDALASARTGEDSVQALNGLADYYEYRGQLNQSIEYRERAYRESMKFEPPLNVAITELRSLGTYVRAGRTETARQKLQRITAALQSPFNLFASLGELEMQLELKRPDEADRAAAQLEKSIETGGFRLVQPSLLNGRGRVAELRGQCNEAITHYEARRVLQPTDATVHIGIGRCFRTLGQQAKSIEHLQMTLRVLPAHARTNYELALTYIESGNRAKAVEHLRRSLETWSQADPAYVIAAEAKAKLKALEATPPRS